MLRSSANSQYPLCAVIVVVYAFDTVMRPLWVFRRCACLLNFPTYFFLTYLFTRLSTTVAIGPFRFQAGCRKRRLNLALVVRAYSVL